MHPIKEKGVIVASDAGQEWILPWWWKYYSAYNTYPVTFIDYGMSENGKKWCRSHGELVPLVDSFANWKEREELDPQIIALWEKEHGKQFWNYRKAWFYKPLALLYTPYRISLWLDLDCQVRANLASLFEENISHIALCPSPNCSSAFVLENHVLPGEIIFNSGVILYKHKDDLITRWAEDTFTCAQYFWTDQHLLSRIIFEGKYSIHILPMIYNWHMVLGINHESKIVHFLGNVGKELIRCECSGYLSFLKLFQKV